MNTITINKVQYFIVKKRPRYGGLISIEYCSMNIAKSYDYNAENIPSYFCGLTYGK